MTIVYLNGDVNIVPCDIIVQQVNCQGVMGKGLALSIKKRYPDILKEYKKFCRENINENDTSSLLGKVHYYDTYDNKVIANIFGQDYYASSPSDKSKYTVESHLLNGLKEVLDLASKNNYVVNIPYLIGCRLGNGNWDKVIKGIKNLHDLYPNNSLTINMVKL